MGILADQLNALVVTATSPDGQIDATVRTRGKSIKVRFQAGSYRRYTERAVAHQLGQLATVSWARYRKAVDRTVDRHCPEVFHDDAIDFGPETRQYNHKLAQLTAEATSSDGTMFVRSRALRQWEFQVADGTVDRLPERQFLINLGTTVRQLLNDHGEQVLTLKDEIYGLGLPEHLRPAAVRRRLPAPNREG